MYICIYFTCFVLFCAYVDSMLVVPICFLILRSDTFLALNLTNSYSHKIYTHQVRITFKTRLDLNRDYFRVDAIRFKI